MWYSVRAGASADLGSAWPGLRAEVHGPDLQLPPLPPDLGAPRARRPRSAVRLLEQSAIAFLWFHLLSFGLIMFLHTVFKFPYFHTLLYFARLA